MTLPTAVEMIQVMIDEKQVAKINIILRSKTD